MYEPEQTDETDVVEDVEDENGEPRNKYTEDKPSRVLTEDKLQEYKDAFALFDKDGNNSISVAELKTVLMSVGKDPTDEGVAAMIATVDQNGNGLIEFDEFIQLMECEEKSFKTADLMRQAFDVLDPNGNGYITMSRLKHVATDMGCEFTDEEIDDMMKEADSDGDGKVKFEGLIGENDTLPTDYEKRENIEDIKREETERLEADKAELEIAERGSPSEVEDAKEVLGDIYAIPDMKEIARQFDNEHYDQFSRQIPVGGNVVRKPYLKSKNKVHGADDLNVDENIYGSMKNIGGPYENAQGKHMVKQSRLLDPNYYLRKSRGSTEYRQHSRFVSGHLRAISIDFKIDLTDISDNKSKAKNGVSTNQAKITSQCYAERAKREKQSIETKLYYALWRTAFTKAIERLRENKQMKMNGLTTPDMSTERTEREGNIKQKQTYANRQKLRITIISPTLKAAQKNLVKKSKRQITRHVINKGSYAQRFKKINNLVDKEDLELEKHHEQVDQMPGPKRRLATLQKRGDVII